MGIQQGSISLCRYRLLGGGKRRLGLATLNELFEPHKSGPIKLNGVAKEELIGWVRPLGIDAIEASELDHWDLSHCQIDDGFLLRMRIERRKVPAQLLQLIYKQQYFDLERKSGKPPGPKARRELKDKVKHELMAKTLPAISHVDAYWRDRSGELTLFTTGKKARELFEKLFQTAFTAELGLQFLRVDSPLMGLPRTHWEDSQVATETLGRLSLTTPVAFAQHVYP